MSKMKVAIVDYKMSNLFSIKNALDKIGIKSFITSNPKEILSSDGAILPGVGSFPEAMNHINNLELPPALIEFISSGKPFMGICLGMQILFSQSDEFEKTAGLDIIHGFVQPLSRQDHIKLVPHVGWNKVYKNDSRELPKIFDSIEDSSHFYFVHSFYANPNSDDVVATYTEYNNFKFCSSIAKDNLFASQFHPEKSGVEGLKLLENFFVD